MKTNRFFSVSGLFISLLAISLLFASCNFSKEEEDNKIPIESFSDVTPDLDKEVSEFIYPLPDSYTVTEMLNRIGIPYMLGTSNTVENVNRYFTAKSKAYNIGVYGSDLSYSSTYQMTQETMLYLEAVNQLGSDLGISSIYNEDLLNRIDQNVNNKDSLIEIITITIHDTYDYLNKNGKGDLSLLMVAGGWVEAMYLTTNVSANVYNNPEIVKIIYSQKPGLENLIKIVEERKDNPDVKELLDDLQPIMEAYNAATSENMTEEQLEALSAAIEKLRTKFIS